MVSVPCSTGLEGVYNWSYSGGEFLVELRPFGSFYCKSYPASSTWSLEDKTVKIDWQKFGKYELEVIENANGRSIL
jgi:hypothetical protein